MLGHVACDNAWQAKRRTQPLGIQAQQKGPQKLI